ncbi:DUF1667 domain-containing protein [Anaerococcus sp. AGMB00486]|uniref:DUF1667 domain-containing protein n=2 Tax=Anaerococcus TaxID=165779 RepID=A0ABX2NBI6_9FIRM|nr:MULTISPECIES: DUF1667 domain-containing protein [Anaerococcus]MDY3006649.1 DUF1667 domain-containing protein [Anaerococcus porci]MSS78116.1 DUF1667 domain-containing protein [Anaerococcus porci]NVF12080.1 DUF1667 domain-containing protein [Anaerococcus faecalis]
MKKELTCINCPLGCNVIVTMDDKGEIQDITGNTCKRGEIYARNEVKNPVRMVTSTVKVIGGKLYSVPVKTSDAIAKDKMKEAMYEINKASIKAPVHIGDVVVNNIANTGIDLIATANRK